MEAAGKQHAQRTRGRLHKQASNTKALTRRQQSMRVAARLHDKEEGRTAQPPHSPKLQSLLPTSGQHARSSATACKFDA